MPSLSVLLCTRNRGEKIKNAVDSILANSFTNFELVIVDQSSDTVTQKAIETYDDARIRYIQTDTVGLSRSRNIAIMASKADIVVFTDDDCICDDGWLATIFEEFEKDPSLMGVYGRVLPFGGSQHADMICPCVIDSTERRVVQSAVIPYGILGHGNNMSFKKKVFQKIGLYIESLGAGTWMKGGEDTDMIYRALRARMKFVYSPKPLVYHDNWMPATKAADLECGYILSAVAVFVKYALKLDIKAMIHLRDRGWEILQRINYHLRQNNKDEFRTASARLKWFIIGFAMGFKYLCVFPPKYESRTK